MLTLAVLAIAAPLVILDLALKVYALRDLLHRPRVRGDSKFLWALVILFVNAFGPVVYLLYGREEQ